MAKQAAQSAHPVGLMGQITGFMMSLGNADMNRAAVDGLQVGPEERVLEIGFGPGDAIKAIASRAVRGFVAGVDISASMVQMAARRNRRAIAGGRVRLDQGSVSALPYSDATFDKVLAVNSVQFWPDLGAGLAEVRRVLRPEGQLMLAMRVADPARPRFFDRLAFTEDRIRSVCQALNAAGFQVARQHQASLKLVTALFVTATR